MVRTHGGHRYSPRVQTCTPARDGAGTSRAAVGHSPAQNTEAPLTLTPDAALMQSPASAAIPEEAQGFEPPSRRYHTWVGPRPPLLYIHDHPGGPCFPSGPRHLGQGCLRGLGLSLHLLQLLRVHRLSYPHIRGLGVRCLVVARYQGTWIA